MTRARRQLRPHDLAAPLADSLRATASLLHVLADSAPHDRGWRDLADVLERAATVVRTPARLPAEMRARIDALEALIVPNDLTPVR